MILDADRSGAAMFPKFQAEAGEGYVPTAPFVPLEWQLAPWRDKSNVLLLTGAAGGGKSKLAAEKIVAYCLKYPGAMTLVLRKTAASHGNSTVLFLQGSVMGNMKVAEFKTVRQRFEFKNGSIMAFMGMDTDEQRKRLRSIGMKGGLDFVWLEEAIEFSEEDYNAVLSRMRGRAASWRQILLTTNPDTPLHWIYRRLIQGKEASVHYSSAINNPYNPVDYLKTLDKLTGVDKDRLTLGKWVQASGLVYPEWSDGPLDGNVSEAAEYVPDGGTVLWAVDDGYVGAIDPISGYYTPESHPRVFLLCQLMPNGILHVFEEHYAVRVLPDQHINTVKELGYIDGKSGQFVKYPEPDYVVVDKSAAELIGRLTELGFYTRRSAQGLTGQGNTSVEEMIKEMRRWISSDENGVRKLLVHPRCRQFRAEMLSYAREQGSERIIKMSDNGPDSCVSGETLVTTFEGHKPISSLRLSDLVLTRNGYSEITAIAKTGIKKTIKWVCSNGYELILTPDHKIWSETRNEFFRADSFLMGESLLSEVGIISISSISENGVIPVYDITVNEQHEFFANGILSSNCRYIVWSVRHGFA